MKPLKLSIEEFLGLKSTEIEISKNILYGANATGKSRAIYALLYVLEPTLLDPKAGKYFDLSKASIRVSTDEEIRYDHGFFECGGSRGDHRSLIRCIESFFDRASVRSYAWITPERIAYRGLVGGTLGEIRDLSDILRDPREVEELEDDWSLFTTISRFYYDSVKTKNGHWIGLSQLSTGEKMAMLITYLAKRSDLLVIETFEGGLHADLAIDLITWLNNNAKYVVLETHLGLVLSKALELGWNVYLFDYRKPPIRIGSREQLLSQDLFKEELESYVRM